MKQKIIIVDKKDNVIGYKDRDALSHDDIYRVSALWITNSKGDILLAKRALTKSHNPGQWGPSVAGTVEKEESYESNIIKEAEEEIGLKSIAPQAGPKGRVSGKFNHFTQWYFFKIDKSEKEFVVDKNEVDEIKWFSKAELKQEMQINPDKFLKSLKKWVEAFCS